MITRPAPRRVPAFVVLAVPVLAGWQGELLAQSLQRTAGVGRETYSADLAARGPLASPFASDPVACVHLHGEVFVSARLSDPMTGQSLRPQVFVYSAATSQYLRAFDQPVFSNPDTLFQGGSTDGVNLMFLSTDGIHVIDPINGLPVTTIASANGVVGLTANPIPHGFPVTNLSAGSLAFDPQGDGGNGSFLVTGEELPSSSILEFARSGALLEEYPYPGAGAVEAMELDPLTRHLWINSEPMVGGLVEFELTPMPGPNPGIVTQLQRLESDLFDARGMGVVPGGLDGRNRGYDLLSVGLGLQSSRQLAGNRLHLWDHYPQTSEPTLVVGRNGGPLAEPVGLMPVPASTTTLDFDLSRPGIPYMALINLEPESLVQRPVGSIGPFDEFWELRRLTDFTLPQGTFVSAVLVSGTRLDLPVTAGLLNRLPEQVRVQALYIDFSIVDPGQNLNLAFGVTNDTGWSLQ